MTSEDRDLASATPSADGSRSSSSRGRRQRKHLPLWQETFLLLGVALVLAIIVKSFLVQAFYIPSESMEPGLVNRDRILVQKVSYWGGGSPERGDVVVFKDPGSWLRGVEEADNLVVKGMTKIGLYPSGGHLVKRVIGVAGDVITCCDDQGRLAVNGEPLDEDAYVKDDPLTQCNGPMVPNCDWEAGPVPEGHIFVMGDNRGRSADSSEKMCRKNETDCVPGREFVPVDLVVGKVFVLIWPWSHFRWVTRPDSFADVPDAG
ncbi:signal peptidase I [Nocardioides houyundeii]|uniref:signal peptidase I n=1 Tax=Nocardioides houyundeii TaxID=2045452 RepID=UPI000C76DA57|nr:signal peptidase I [Nocardioides houyundeii]